MDSRDRVDSNSKVCPECGSELAVEPRPYGGAPVAVAVCTGYPDCAYFRWSAPEDGGELPLPLLFSGLADWAVRESLAILREEFSSEGWAEALGAFTEPLGEGGEGGG